VKVLLSVSPTAFVDYDALAKDKRANAAVIFALSAVPLIAILGLGIDYYRNLSNKSRLDAAADSAAVAAVETMKAYIGANAQSQTSSALITNAEAAAAAQAKNVFYANAGDSAPALSSVPTISVAPSTASPLIIDATISYSAQISASFGALVGVNTLNFSGSSQASMQIGAYQDIYLVLDVSASMGVPTSQADQLTFAPLNPDNQYTPSQYPNGCMFACHYVSSPGDSDRPYQGFNYAETKNIMLRIDSLSSAILNLMNYAMQPGTAMFPDQYQLGVYPFITDAIDAVPLTYLSQSQTTLFTPTPGSVVVNGVTTPTNQYTTPFATQYLDSGWLTNSPKASDGTPIGSGGTHFENLWKDMQKYLRGAGTGTSWSPQGVIFLVTDGADDSQTFTASTISPSGFSGPGPQVPPATPTTSDLCQSAKNAGYTVAVLLIPYVQIPNSLMNTSVDGDEDGLAMAIAGYNPSASPSPIETRMQACATSGYYAEAYTDAQISAAIQKLFTQVTQQPRLTQ
jgi:Flp pilus assembly protein TadG